MIYAYYVDVYCRQMKRLEIHKNPPFSGCRIWKRSDREKKENCLTALSRPPPKGHWLGDSGGAPDEWTPGRLYLEEEGWNKFRLSPLAFYDVTDRRQRVLSNVARVVIGVLMRMFTPCTTAPSHKIFSLLLLWWWLLLLL